MYLFIFYFYCQSLLTTIGYPIYNHYGAFFQSFLPQPISKLATIESFLSLPASIGYQYFYFPSNIDHLPPRIYSHSLVNSLQKKTNQFLSLCFSVNPLRVFTAYQRPTSRIFNKRFAASNIGYELCNLHWN